MHVDTKCHIAISEAFTKLIKRKFNCMITSLYMPQYSGVSEAIVTVSLKKLGRAEMPYRLLALFMVYCRVNTGKWRYQVLSVAINSIFCDFYIIVRPVSHCVTRLFDSESYSKIWLVNRRGSANAPRIPLSRESLLLMPWFFPVKSVWRRFSTKAHAVRLPEVIFCRYRVFSLFSVKLSLSSYNFH